MKKKIALLLAAVMTLAAMVPANLFASSTSTLTVYYTNAGANRVITNNTTNFGSYTNDEGIVANATPSYLKINVTSPYTTNDIVQLKLTNGKWLFTGNTRTEVESSDYGDDVLSELFTSVNPLGYNFPSYDITKGQLVTEGTEKAYYNYTGLVGGAGAYRQLNTDAQTALKNAIINAAIAKAAGTGLGGIAAGTVITAATQIEWSNAAADLPVGAAKQGAAADGTLEAWATLVAKALIPDASNNAMTAYTFTDLTAAAAVDFIRLQNAVPGSLTAGNNALTAGNQITSALVTGQTITGSTFTFAEVYGVSVGATTNPETGTNSIPFRLAFSAGDPSVAFFKPLVNGSGGTNQYFYIPMNLYTGTDENVTVEISASSQGSFVTPTSIVVANNNAATGVAFDSVKEGRDNVTLDTLTITEKVAATLKTGYIVLIAPEGTDWTATAGVTVTSDTSIINASLASISTPALDHKFNGATIEKERILVMGLTIPASVGINGKIYIKNLKLNIDTDEVPVGTTQKVLITSPDQLTSIPATGSGSAMTGATIGKTVTRTSSSVLYRSLDAFKRVDYGIAFERDSSSAAIPELYSGDRNDNQSPTTWAATVKFAENSYLSWWSNQTTTFTLVDKEGTELDGVKITGYEITKTDNIAGSTPKAFGTVKNGYVTYKNDKTDINKKTSITFKLQLSAAADFAGEVYLKASANTVPKEDLPVVQILNVVSPVTVTTKTTYVQVGYQTINVEEINVVENVVNIFKKGENVEFRVQVFNELADDIHFVNIGAASTVLNKGDGKVGSPKLVGKTVVTVEVEKASSKEPIDFTLKGLQIYINRSTPEGYYDLGVGGPAFVHNYVPNATELKTGDGKYHVFGVVVPKYITVATPGTNKILSRNVMIQGDNDQAIIDGTITTLEAAPIIENDRMLVPVRFISTALGIDEGNVKWDATDRKVIIIAAERIVEFWVGTNKMAMNGVSMNLTEKDGTPIVCKINPANDRSYIPFRALGNAFSIKVGYNEETKYAIYNPTPEQIASGASTAE